jgi:hypothetical protein
VRLLHLEDDVLAVARPRGGDENGRSAASERLADDKAAALD